MGQVQLIYQFKDQAGHAAPSVTRPVMVADLTPPRIELIGENSIQHPMGIPFVDPGAQAWDELDGNLTDRIRMNGIVDIEVEGAYALLYSVKDNSGNRSSWIAREVVVYNLDPTDLLLSESQVVENQPAGTVVGTLSMVDPNDPEGVGSMSLECWIIHPICSPAEPGWRIITTRPLDSKLTPSTR